MDRHARLPVRHQTPLPEGRPGGSEAGLGAWREPQQILNAPHTLPASGEKTPVGLHDLSPLHVGSEQDDSRNLVAMDGPVVELRLPWALLGLADPSSRQFTDPQADGTIGRDPLPESARVGIEVFDGAGRPIGKASPGYGWEPWQRVVWHERRKAGWDTLRAAFAESIR